MVIQSFMLIATKDEGNTKERAKSQKFDVDINLLLKKQQVIDHHVFHHCKSEVYQDIKL